MREPSFLRRAEEEREARSTPGDIDMVQPPQLSNPDEGQVLRGVVWGAISAVVFLSFFLLLGTALRGLSG